MSIQEIIENKREENPGKQPHAFHEYAELLKSAVSFGSDMIEEDKSPEYNIAFLSDLIEMSFPDIDPEDIHDLVMIILTEGENT